MRPGNRESLLMVRVLGPTFILLLLASAVACGSSDKDNGAAGGSGGGPAAGRGGVPNGDGGKGGKGGKSGAGGTANAGGSGGSSATSGKGGSGKGGSGKGGSGKGGSGNAGSGATATGGTGAQAADAGNAGEAGDVGTPSTGGSGGTGAEAGSGGAGGDVMAHVTFTIDATSTGHAISPLIYGINPGGIACSNPNAPFGLCRLGGDRWSTYNWETNASNAGAPLCFQNDAALGASDEAGKSVTDLVSEASTRGAAALLTLPMLDYVAADKDAGTPAPDCSGDVRKSGDDYLDTRFKANVAVKGAALVATPDTSDDSVYEDEFVAFVKAAAGSANVLFALDNQPGLWGTTQAVVHPAAPTYAEVVARNVTYAKMLRDVWPEAPISGYVGYGWTDFESLQNSPDASTEGRFLDYYLGAVADASESDGRRLIDYLDVHWFPEVYAGPSFERITDNTTTPAVVAARLQAPRSLWDPSYVEDSWITRDSLGGQPIRLVRWLKERIAANYPGTKVAISEWNYGGGTDVSGALAAADALGIFGREDVGLAAWKSLAGDDPFVLGAFRMFRNYDGAGAAFGDVSLPAASDAIERASVYASADTQTPGRVVIIAINRSESELDATLSIETTATFMSAATYVLTSASATPSAGAPLTTTTANQFAYALPPYSVSVVVPGP